MPQESLEHRRMDEGHDRPVDKNKGDKPVDTLYYRPFEAKGRKDERLTLEQIEKNEEKTEKMKERFNELILMFSEGRLDTPVEVSGENHWMELNRFFKKGMEQKSEDLIKEVNKGMDPADINLEFKLIKTEGRAESLNIDFKVSAERLMAGGGELKEDLKKNITDIFGGTSRHYQNIRESREQETKQEAARENPQVDQIQKIAMEEGLRATGYMVTRINNGAIFTLIAEHPVSQRKVMVSLYGDREPWRLEKITGKEDKVENFAGPPDEVLSEIYKFIETEG